MILTGKQIIAAEFSSSGAERFYAKNPATGADLEPQFFEATQADVDRAAAAASAVFDQYSRLPLPQRAAFLESIGEELLGLAPELLARAHAETALPFARLEGELARTVYQLKLFAQMVRQGAHLELRIDRPLPARAPVSKPDIRAMQVPLGPVVVFGASNFPLAFAVAGGDTAAALAAGCPVVVKGHPLHPGTSELAALAVCRAALKNQLPAAVFSLLQGKQMTLGAALVQQPLIKAVAFTGSLTGGRTLFDLACCRPEPIPLYAEMGSVNPIFFLPQIIADNCSSLAKALVDSLTLGVGQFCTKPGLLLLIKDAATAAFLSEVESCLAMQPPGIMLSAGIKLNFLAGIKSLLSVKGVEGCTASEPALHGCLVAPQILRTDAKSFLDNPEIGEEVFGPLAVAVVCESRAEMAAVAESLQGQLTATVHGSARELIESPDLFGVLERKCGRLLVNNFPTGVEVCASMQHGGPYPATTDSRSTSVGIAAVKRFLRPVCYQNFPQELLPEPLRDQNLLHLWRLLDGQMSRDDAL